MLLEGFFPKVESGMGVVTTGASLMGLTTTSTSPVLLTVPSRTV